MQTRRQFLREGLAATVAFIAVGCNSSRKRARPPATTTPSTTATTTSTPTFTPAPDVFGGRVHAGSVDAIRKAITTSHEPYYIPEARAYVSPFPPEFVDRARAVYPAAVLPILESGFVVLYQRCTHLGCRVPFCESSQWFECPCHAARFDRVGEQRAGPAPRGMDLFPASIESGRLVIDTGAIQQGLPNGTNTTHQANAGPFCVG